MSREAGRRERKGVKRVDHRQSFYCPLCKDNALSISFSEYQSGETRVKYYTCQHCTAYFKTAETLMEILFHPGNQIDIAFNTPKQ